MTISFKGGLTAGDWVKMKTESAADDFDNGRNPEQARGFIQFGFEKQAVGLGWVASSASEWTPCPASITMVIEPGE